MVGIDIRDAGHRAPLHDLTLAADGEEGQVAREHGGYANGSNGAGLSGSPKRTSRGEKTRTERALTTLAPVAPCRRPPCSIEAEQALLGAMLVENKAHGRVSDFLRREHFFDRLHGEIFEAASTLIAIGKKATPITLQPFFENAEPIDASLTVPQYLGRLAVSATTIVNARDYGRTIHDLATRRSLILVGEDMVNAAYDSPVDFGPREQIGEAAKRLEALGESTEAQAGGLKPITLTNFLDAKIPEREAILEGLLHQRATAMVYSWRGVGKTWFMLGLGWAAASAGQFLKWKAKRTHKVLHVCGELVASELQARLKIIAGPSADRGHCLNYRLLSSDLHDYGIPDLASPEGQAAIERVLGDTELLLLDNISTLFRAGVENEAESWVPVQNWFLKLRRRGVAIVVVHHAGKAKEQRGTSKREDILDLVLSLRTPDDYDPESDDARFDVRFEKGRGLKGAEKAPFEAKLETQEGKAAAWKVRDIEESRFDAIRDLLAEKKSVRQIADAIGLSKSAVQRAIKKMQEGGT
jgi:hypothetical protein